VTLDEFEHTIFTVADRSPLCDEPNIVALAEETIKIRIELFDGGWVEAYYNQRTQTTAYVFIKAERRIFGADNTGGWHLHPFDNPQRHDPLGEPLSFVEFIAAIEQADERGEIL
jgi:hypothetical protein